MTDLLSNSLAVAGSLNQDEVAAELAALRGAGLSLVAGGHLARDPLVLVAAELELSVGVVSGDAALKLTENLNVVPGAATATDWRLHVPAPAPLTGDIKAAVKGLAHVTTDEVTAPQAASAPGPAVNLAALSEGLGS